MELKRLVDNLIQQLVLIGIFIMMRINSMVLSAFPKINFDDNGSLDIENNEYSITYQLKPVLETILHDKHIQKFQVHVLMDTTKTLVPLLFIPIPTDSTQIIHEGIYLKNNRFFISFTTSSTSVDKLYKIPLTISFVNYADLQIMLNSKKSFELPGIPINSFMFIDQNNWFSKFKETDEQTWTYNINIEYNKTNKNFTYKI